MAKRQVKRDEKVNHQPADADQGKLPSDVSRRRFLKNSALGAGVAAAGLGGAKASFAREEDSTAKKQRIRIPKELTDSLAQEARTSTFEGKGMAGTEVFAKACKDEGLGAMFCAPGNYGIINALASEGIPSYGGRTEGSMCAAADGFVRVSGEIAACSGTEGPGFTNMIMNIAAANAARTPLLVLASNKSISMDDTERTIQVGYQQPTTEGLRKYGKRLITANRIYEYSAYAFRQLKNGVPGPVHLDFPSEVTRGRYTDPAALRMYYDKSRYRTEARPNPAPADVARAVEMIRKAKRPLIVASMGVFYDKAWDALKQAAEKADIAVVESGPMRGHFSDGHRLSANTAPTVLRSADLVIFVGQYCMPSVGEFAFNLDAKVIRIHPVGEDIGRNWPIDLGIVSGEKAALEALAEALRRTQRTTWTDELAAARKAFEDENEDLYKTGLESSRKNGAIHPAIIGKGLSDFLYGGDLPKEQTTFVMGGYGVARWARRYIRAFRPGQILNGPYQYGAIGPDVGYTVGAGAAVAQGAGCQAAYKGSVVFGVTGDAGFGYSGMEMETLAKYRIPAVMIVYNNNAWGVWGSGRRGPRTQHMYLFQENLRYDKVAEGLGARGECVTRAEDFVPALKRSYEIAAAEGVPTLISCQGRKEDNASSMRKTEPGCMSYYH